MQCKGFTLSGVCGSMALPVRGWCGAAGGAAFPARSLEVFSMRGQPRASWPTLDRFDPEFRVARDRSRVSEVRRWDAKAGAFTRATLHPAPIIETPKAEVRARYADMVEAFLATRRELQDQHRNTGADMDARREAARAARYRWNEMEKGGW